MDVLVNNPPWERLINGSWQVEGADLRGLANHQDPWGRPLPKPICTHTLGEEITHWDYQVMVNGQQVHLIVWND